jgi:hypothetical protein
VKSEERRVWGMGRGVRDEGLALWRYYRDISRQYVKPSNNNPLNPIPQTLTKHPKEK